MKHTQLIVSISLVGLIYGTSCPPGQFVDSWSSCAVCPISTTSFSGNSQGFCTSCTSLNPNILSCMQSVENGPTLATSCRGSYYLSNGDCLKCGPSLSAASGNTASSCPISCPSNALACNVDKLPYIVTSCSKGFVVSSDSSQCITAPVWDFLQGFSIKAEGEELKTQFDTLATDCLALCQSSSECTTISFTSRRPQSPGICVLLSSIKVGQGLKQQPNSAPYDERMRKYFAVLVVRKNPSVSALGNLPYTVGTCDGGIEGCFTTCGKGSSAYNKLGAQCMPCDDALPSLNLAKSCSKPLLPPSTDIKLRRSLTAWL